MMDLRPPSVTGGKVEWAFYKIGSEFHTETYCTGFGGWISVIRNGMACTKSNQVVLVFVSGHVFFYHQSRRHFHYYRIEPLGGSEINSTAAPAAYPNELMNLCLLDGFSGPSVPKAMAIQSQTPFA
jgi:hypothetical protein